MKLVRLVFGLVVVRLIIQRSILTLIPRQKAT